MPSWLKSFTEAWRFWQTWLFTVTTTIPTIVQVWAAKSRGVPLDQLIFYGAATFMFCAVGAVFVIHLIALVGTKVGDGMRAWKVADMLENLHRTKHDPVTVAYVIQLYTGVDPMDSTLGDMTKAKIEMRDIKACGSMGHFGFQNVGDRAHLDDCSVKSICDYESTAKFFRRLAWSSMKRMLLAKPR
jgi:hypothetical protein